MDRSPLIPPVRATLLFLAALASGATPSAAQDIPLDTAELASDDAADADSSDAVRSVLADVVTAYAVPDMPAATFLGTTPATIARPATGRDFLVGLASGVDENGRARQGFALEASPLAVIPGLGISLDQYRAAGFNPRYLLANLLLSLGAAQAAGDTAPTTLAYGLRLTVFDAGDPMRDPEFLRALGDSIARCRPRTPLGGIPHADRPTQLTAELRDLMDERHDRAVRCMGSHTRKLARRYARAHWNASNVTLAYAGGERLNRSSFAERRHAGDRVWVTAALRAGTAAQAIAYVDWSHVRDAGIRSYSAVTYGARVNVGSEAVNGFAELLGQERFHAPGGGGASGRSWSAGVELRAAMSLWISAGLGERFRQTARPDAVAVIASLRWGISLGSRLSPGN
ncbi:MAG TPA: hypothetical protein VIC55_06340 [Gemmatimonadaceae bacterium]|jgi:hypothetical protein